MYEQLYFHFLKVLEQRRCAAGLDEVGSQTSLQQLPLLDPRGIYDRVWFVASSFGTGFCFLKPLFILLFQRDDELPI
jgi:hypothetical protein